MNDKIARIAYAIYEKGGRMNGYDIDNWLEAERIVLAHNSKKQAEVAAEVAVRKKRTAKTGATINIVRAERSV